MPLFQTSVLKKYLNQEDETAVATAYKAFTAYFHNSVIQENIRSSKEEEYQGIFLTELFVKILGYTMKPHDGYNLVAEYKNEKNSKKADGAILKDDQAIGVIELKGTNTKDLENVRQQAFDYKANQSGCVYVITSNFEKVRFYINNAVDHEEFDLFTLTPERFALMYLCLAKDHLLHHTPLKIKEASLQEEEAITKQFYSDYSLFKRELFRDLVRGNMKNDVFREEMNRTDSDRAVKNIKQSLFRKSQKLIDRFLFIFFAEDRGLLPPNSTRQILDKWKADNDFGDERPLFELFKQYFRFLDTGRQGTASRAEIFAYNGGLFRPDTVLDSLHISNDLLYKHALRLQAYDFESQVDVNILGHIFENSLNEIESVSAEIEGTSFDKQKTKRKKDGVFYTPKYITKYIVDNTIGKLCTEKKAEIGIVEDEYLKSRKGRRLNTLRDLQERLDKYRNWLLRLTICDPACGSGAFLNQALDFLIREHAFLDELKNALVGGGFLFPDIENTILEKNIYGVDLNQESVEIAKLSLWLRTAQPRRKLNDLSSNIKCGNSLIDSKTVAGDKAFNWEEEFPHIFQEKHKTAWHFTTATHDSRTSQRMIDHKVRLKRDGGTRPKAEPIWLYEADEILIAEKVAEVVKKDKLNVLAFNICGDHMHILLVCEPDEMNKIVGKIKSITARAYNIEKGITIAATAATRGHDPLPSHIHDTASRGHDPLPLDTYDTSSRGHDPLSNALWTQKFGKNEITSNDQLQNTINYIENNRVKHNLPNSKPLQNIINNICCSMDQAFRAEYKAGFDVVIGNPPYVRPRGFQEKEKMFIIDNYLSAENQFDLYHIFIEKSESLRNKNGIVSMILPNAFLANENSQLLRKYILENCHILQITDCKQEVFKDASVDVLIYVFDNSSQLSEYCELSNNLFEFKHTFEAKNFLRNKNLNFTPTLNSKAIETFQKIKGRTKELGDFFDVMSGIKEYQTGKGKPPQVPQDKIERRFNSTFKRDGTYLPEIRGKHVQRYSLQWENEFVSYGKWLAEPRNPIYFEGPRFFVRQIPAKDSLIACYSDDKYVVDQSAYVIKPKAKETFHKGIIGILNSKLIFWFYRNENNEFDNLFPKIKAKEIRALPIMEKGLNILDSNVSKMEDLMSKLLDSQTKFSTYLQSQYPIEKLSKKLQNWHDLSFGDFVKELTKAIKASSGEKLSKLSEMEWMEVFETKKAEAQALQAAIEKTDKEIDRMVYALYGLTEEEIGIVEGNV